jgi:GAF domain-containing protein
VTDSDDIWTQHAELVGLLDAEETFTETLQRIAALACAAIPGCTSGSVTLWRDDGHPYTVVSTSDLARDIDNAQYESMQGPCLDASRTGETYEITDMRTDGRWPTFAAVAVRRGALSSLSVPLSVRGRSLGALDLYSDQPDGFRDAVRAGQAFAAQASVAIANAELHDASRALAREIDERLRRRATIDQAVGVLMARHGCDAEAAAALLAEETARAGGDELAVARRVVEDAAGPA